jgi:hypothetical protein
MMVTLVAGGGDDILRTVVRMSQGMQENATKPNLGNGKALLNIRGRPREDANLLSPSFHPEWVF